MFAGPFEVQPDVVDAPHVLEVDLPETALPHASLVRHALDHTAFWTVAQPIRNIWTGEVVAVEALTRFSGPPSWSPDRWFVAAHHAGLGVELEVAAVACALDSAEPLPRDVAVSVNVAPVTAADRRLKDLLAAHASTGRPVVLELTEHAIVDDYALLNRALGQLRELGVRIAVDDIGGGFASLRHVTTLRPDILKLDIAFSRGVDQDGVKQALVRSLVSFAAQVGTTLIAEGVERQAELDALRVLGVEIAQGYLLGRPGALADVADACVASAA